MSNENNRPMYYSQIRVDPSNPENVYVGGLNFSKSTDGGKTFVSMQANVGHVDNHAIWIDPKNGNHIVLGNDGGLNVTYDQGLTGTSSTRSQRRSSMRLASTCVSLITSMEVCRTTVRGVGRARRATPRVSRTRIGIASPEATDSTRWRIRVTTTPSMPNRRTET